MRVSLIAFSMLLAACSALQPGWVPPSQARTRRPMTDRAPRMLFGGGAKKEGGAPGGPGGMGMGNMMEQVRLCAGGAGRIRRLSQAGAYV